MPSITINLGSEISNISTYDVFVSNCDPTSWQLVANDIEYDDFPLVINPAGFGADESCVQYYVSGDTGCECSGFTYVTSPSPTPTTTPSITPSITITPTITPSITITPTITPSITITPTITPSITITPTPTPPPCVDPGIDTIAVGDPPENVNVFLGYMATSGSGAYQSLCDLLLCGDIDDIGFGSTLLECPITIPTLSGLPTTAGECVEIQSTDGTTCTTYTQSNFNNDCVPPSFAGQDLYMAVTSESGTTIYTISECGGGMAIQLYGTCDYDGLGSGVVGYDVQLNGNGQWVINGEVEPDLTLECGVEYQFHVCSSGSTTQFWMADQYNISSESQPNGSDALGASDGVDNNGAYISTIVINFSSSGTNGGYWYGYNGVEGSAGQITVTGC
ncbi:MAG: hypothetical protein ACYTA3_01905 [Planctomycetota bacterium]|jgi:hypothetical protein